MKLIKMRCLTGAMLTLISWLPLVSSSSLWVASQSGIVASMSLIGIGDELELNQTFANPDCGSSPTWLLRDEASNTLFCVDEALNGGPGHITSFSINDDSSLSKISSGSTGAGPVHCTLFGTARKGLAVAEYGQGGVSTWTLTQPPGTLSLVEDITFPPLATPGPVTDRQFKNAAHEAILDPTGKFILIPDLGADKIRIFSFDDTTLELQEQPAVDVSPGSGPRHGAFTVHGGVTRFYLVNELSAKVTAFHVDYPLKGGINLVMFQEVFTHGMTSAAGNAPGEIEVTKDQRFLTISNRLTGDIPTANPDPSKSGIIQGDSLSTFLINSDGTLCFLEATSSGGISPRQFATNKLGDMVAVANYATSNIAIFRRDVVTGLIGNNPLASYFFKGSNPPIAAVIWAD